VLERRGPPLAAGAGGGRGARPAPAAGGGGADELDEAHEAGVAQQQIEAVGGRRHVNHPRVIVRVLSRANDILRLSRGGAAPSRFAGGGNSPAATTRQPRRGERRGGNRAALRRANRSI
jgi:hypothetical protein